MVWLYYILIFDVNVEDTQEYFTQLLLWDGMLKCSYCFENWIVNDNTTTETDAKFEND